VKTKMLREPMPDFAPGQVWRLGSDIYRVLEVGSHRIWEGSRGRPIVSSSLRVTQIEPLVEEDTPHYIDESCFVDMHRIIPTTGDADGE
jgi:hypothetical protein